MRHRQKRTQLNRPADQRRAMVRNLLTSLFQYGKVQTTSAKARVLQSEAEKLLTRARRQKEDFNSIRELKKILFNDSSSRSALDYVKNTKKTSGFTRATKIKERDGDGALIIQIDLIRDEK